MSRTSALLLLALLPQFPALAGGSEDLLVLSDAPTHIDNALWDEAPAERQLTGRKVVLATPPVDPPQAGMGGERQTAILEARTDVRDGDSDHEDTKSRGTALLFAPSPFRVFESSWLPSPSAPSIARSLLSRGEHSPIHTP
jgi:hypothetical protein